MNRRGFLRKCLEIGAAALVTSALGRATSSAPAEPEWRMPQPVAEDHPFVRAVVAEVERLVALQHAELERMMRS